MTGIFATVNGVAAFGDLNPGGAIDGNGRQVWIQIVSALFVIGWNLVWTSIIMLFIKYVCRIKLRMSDEDMLIGDDAIHGEAAYCFLDDVDGIVPDAELLEYRVQDLETGDGPNQISNVGLNLPRELRGKEPEKKELHEGDIAPAPSGIKVD